MAMEEKNFFLKKKKAAGDEHFFFTTFVPTFFFEQRRKKGGAPPIKLWCRISRRDHAASRRLATVLTAGVPTPYATKKKPNDRKVKYLLLRTALVAAWFWTHLSSRVLS